MPALEIVVVDILASGLALFEAVIFQTLEGRQLLLVAVALNVVGHALGHVRRPVLEQGKPVSGEKTEKKTY